MTDTTTAGWQTTAVDAGLGELALELLAMPPVELDYFLAQLEPDQLAVCERALGEHLAVGWRATPATMAAHLTHGRIRLWAYTKLLGEKFRQAVRGDSKRQIWNVPARYGKSLFASRWGPAWALDDDPKRNLMLVSYGDDLAMENAIAVRDLLRQHADVLRAQLRHDRQRQDRFVTTEGGGIIAGGVLSALTGFPADGAVLDDPFKNWQEAHSEARRQLIDDQYRSVIRLRLETDDAWIILVHTRWHEDDLTGRLVKRMEDGTGEAWDVVRLPAVAERFDPRSHDPLLRVPDPLGRAPGEVLEPQRFSVAAVASRALSLGSYLTAAMEQQRPAPEEGGELKRAWWKLDSNRPAKADDWLSSWDMKLKDKESGDFVVGQVWARTGSSYWLVDQLRGQWSQATTANAICLLAVRWPHCRRHIVENTGYGPEVMEALRAKQPGYVVDDGTADLLGMTEVERAEVSKMRQRGVGGLVPNNPKGDKRVRARGVSPYIEAGNVHVWEDAPWLGIFLDETAAFPNGTHDDQVDAMSQALSKLVRGGATATVAEGQVRGGKPARGTPQVGRGAGPAAAPAGGRATVVAMPGVQLPRGARIGRR